MVVAAIVLTWLFANTFEKRVGAATAAGAVGTLIAAVVALHSLLSTTRHREFDRFAQAYWSLADAWSGLKWWTSIDRAIVENRELVKEWIASEHEALNASRKQQSHTTARFNPWCAIRLRTRRCPLRRQRDPTGGCPARDAENWETVLCHHRTVLQRSTEHPCSACAAPILNRLEDNKNRADNLDRARHLQTHLEAKLREIGQISRPTDPDQLIDWLRKRHHRLSELNSALLDLVPATHREENLTPPCPDRDHARAQWSHAIHEARARVARWPSLTGVVETIDVLADYWWVLASMDPLYRHPDPATRQERLRAYKQAEEALADLAGVVTTRRLGVNRFRRLILRLVHDPLTIEAMNRVNRQI